MADRQRDIYHVRQDDEYTRLSAAEAEYWNRPHLFNLDVELPVIDPYRSERFTGDANVTWYEAIPRYGSFQRGCVLGTGALREISRLLEQNADLHVTLYDISSESLARRERELRTRFPGRVDTQQADLNFAELPVDSYDLVVSSFCLHHLLNLEHVAFQINRALRPHGYFFHCDYVGEPRFQFSAGKKLLFEALLEVASARLPALQCWRIAWPDLSNWEHSPFEAVRSDEILGICRGYLKEESVRAGSTLLWLLLWLRWDEQQAARGSRSLLRRITDRLRLARPDEVPNIKDVIIQVGPEIACVDRAVTEAGLFLPWDALAVYRKRTVD